MGIIDYLKKGSPLELQEVTTKDVGERMLLVHPPEPPPEFLMNDPDDSIYLGKTKAMDVPFQWTYANLTNPHICVVGVTGSGKSYLVKTFLTRASLVWDTNAIIIDWAGEYSEWVEQVGGKVIRLGAGSYLNLLDLGGMRPLDRVSQIMRTLEILTDVKGKDDERRVTEEAIEDAYERAGFVLFKKDNTDKKGKELIPPTLKDVLAILEERAKEADSAWIREYIKNAAKRIEKFTKEGADYFASQSTVRLDELTKSGLVDIVLTDLPDEEFRALAGLMILQFLKEKMREEGWAKTKGLKTFVVLDEAWKIAKDDRSDAIMIVREGRKYQFGLIVASQNPTDINKAIFSNVGTTMILNLKFKEYKDYVQESLNYSNYIASAIEQFGVGNAAINLVYSERTDFPQTFLIEKIHGEEPLVRVKIDLSRAKGKSLEFERGQLKRRLAVENIVGEKLARVLSMLAEKGNSLDVIEFVKLLEEWDYSRKSIIDILRGLGVPNKDITNIFLYLRGGKV
ncbi:MAG: ATP-binding protein [Candidatus Micrarchaeota archaeon]